MGIIQVECEIAVHLCPQRAATWRNRPWLLSSDVETMAALAAKPHSAAEQTFSTLHAMAKALNA